MINTFQSRPQSKSYKSKLSQARPITRHDGQQQAQKCFQMGKQHHNRNDLQKAQKFYLQATIHNPAHFKSYCNLGLCYKLRGQYPNSIQAYKKSLSINPTDPITNYNLANVYRLIGDQQKSIKHYLYVIQLKQKQNVDVKSLYLDSYNNLGICYKNTGNYDKSIQCFQKIIKQRPNDQQVKFNLAVCNLRRVRKMTKGAKDQNSMLFKQNLLKTKHLFEEFLKKESTNQVAILALIQVRCLENHQQANLKKYVLQIDQLTKKQNTSSFIKDEASKLKGYCLNLLAKYEESAEEYRKAMQKKKQEQERKLAEQRQRLKAIQNSKKPLQVKKSESFKATTIIAPQPKSQLTVQKKEQQKIIKNQVTQVKPLDMKKIYSDLLFSLLSRINTFLQKATSQQLVKFEQQGLAPHLLKMIQQIIKQQKQLSNQKIISTQRIRKQLAIVGNSIFGEKLTDKKYFVQAFDIYNSYFLSNNIQFQINKDTLFLQTHRAIASVLTTLGYSQKAIQHYQIINQQFITQNIKDKDPLQELHSGLAVNYESQGLHEKAIKQFEQAIRLNPKNYILYYNLGYCQHCAGLNQQAIKSYQSFLNQIQRQSNLDIQSKKSYILQALISIFICSQGSAQDKLKKCQQIESKFEQYSKSSMEQVLKLIDNQTLMHYYLLACDLYEQLVFESIKQMKSTKSLPTANLKQYKQKLFNIYINLLELPNCPDRDQILINCGNMLFEERQFMSALQFYQKVSKSKIQVFNIIGLTLLNISQHERALNCMQFAIECDKKNKIYKINYEIMRWAYGLINTQIEQNKTGQQKGQNLLVKNYACQCDKMFQLRVQIAKSLINKLTNFIEFQLYQQQSSATQNNQLFNIQQLSVKQIFQILLKEQDKQKSYWKQPQSYVKHSLLMKLFKQHYSKIHKQSNSNYVQNNQIQSILQLIVNNQNSPQKIINQFINKLNHTKIINCSDYLNVTQNLLGSFIFFNTKNQQQSNNLKKTIQSKITSIPTYQLNFSDSVISNSNFFPSKTFTVLYPSIQLKLQNILQSLVSWQTQLEDQFVYLYKIIQTIAYRNQITAPVSVDYNFPYCKNLQNYQKCLKKAYYILSKLLNIDLKQNFNNQNKNKTIEQIKKYIYTLFSNKFGKNLEPFLKSVQGQQNKTLTFQLTEQTLPLEIQIIFKSQQAFKKFLKQLCAQISVKQPAFDKNNNQIYLILNKLIRVKCIWSQQINYVQNFLYSLKNSSLGLRQTCLQFFDDQVLKQWSQQTNLKPLMQKIFQNIDQFSK